MLFQHLSSIFFTFSVILFSQIGVRSVEGMTHECLCTYNAEHPKGHCTCEPPIPKPGDNFVPLPGVIPSQQKTGQRSGGPGPALEAKEYKCTCVYNAEHPNGHCNCVPPFPGSDPVVITDPVPRPKGNDARGHKGDDFIPLPSVDIDQGPFVCECVKNSEFPQGKCTCDKEMCFNDSHGKRICVSG